MTGGIFAYQEHRQAGLNARFRAEKGNLGGDFAANLYGQRLAVENPSGH
jgi:hypothetical protein